MKYADKCSLQIHPQNKYLFFDEGQRIHLLSEYHGSTFDMDLMHNEQMWFSALKVEFL